MESYSRNHIARYKCTISTHVTPGAYTMVYVNYISRKAGEESKHLIESKTKSSGGGGTTVTFLKQSRYPTWGSNSQPRDQESRPLPTEPARSPTRSYKMYI